MQAAFQMSRSNWFGFEEWKAQGLPILSTASQEAVKLYDAAITQSVAWYDDPAFGGFKNTLIQMQQADPQFRKALTLGSQLLGFADSYYGNADVKAEIDSLLELAEKRKSQISEREYKHVQALHRMSKMDWKGAAGIWDDILLDSPTDMHAIKSAFFMRFYTGEREKQLQMMERAYPHFQSRRALHSDHMHGYYGFALQETGRYSKAEEYAKLGLDANAWDGWATHTMAHVTEMTGRFEEGLSFMSSRNQLWTRANHLGCHNYWHHALFNIATGDFDGALTLLQEQMLPRMRATQTPFSVIDSSSLLYRLLFVDQANRSFDKQVIANNYNQVFEVAQQYLHRHILGFSSTHFMMACLGSGNLASAIEMRETFSHSKLAKLQPEVATVAGQIMDAMMEHARENYAKATDLLYSVKDSIWMLGGSNAQRDVYSQLLLLCALKSNKLEHKKILHEVLQERQVFEQNDRFLISNESLVK